MPTPKLEGHASRLNIVIEQGSTFNPVFTYKDDSVNPAVVIDITGFTARMHIRQTLETATTLVELTTENGGITLGGVAGTITLLITDTVTAAMDPDDYDEAVYDMELISGSSVVTRIMKGGVILSTEVTR